MGERFEEKLEEYLKTLQEFEDFLKHGKEVEKNTFKVKISPQSTPDKELFLDLLHSIRGLVSISISLPDGKEKELIQKEVLKLVSPLITNYESLFSFNLDPNSPSRLSTYRNVYGFMISLSQSSDNKLDIRAGVSAQNKDQLVTILFRIIGLQGLIEETLTTQTAIISKIESYKEHIENKLQELYKAKEELESFLKEKSLDLFSKRFEDNAKHLESRIEKLQKATIITFSLTVLAVFCLLIFFPGKIQSFLTKLTIVAIFGGTSFYLLRYTIRLLDRQDEYKYKALTLSTFPALNYFLQDDNARYELIKTIILENQKLKTLSSKEERLPLEEVAKLLSVLKSGK